MTSRAQVDKLGERLKAGPTTAEDLRLLDEYRQTFRTAYSEVVTAVAELGFEPTGRPAKSTSAIIDKLRRESIRLTQIQDIAGCRVVVRGLPEQNIAADTLSRAFPGCRVVDRRRRPSNGYRAVHLVVEIEGRPVETQVRTRRQQLWAELSEQAADRIDPGLKYGHGPAEVVVALDRLSRAFAAREEYDVVGQESRQFTAIRTEVFMAADHLADVLQKRTRGIG